jgi:hypothetical protein
MDRHMQVDGRTRLTQDTPRQARTGELREFGNHRGGDLALLMRIQGLEVVLPPVQEQAIAYLLLDGMPEAGSAQKWHHIEQGILPIRSRVTKEARWSSLADRSCSMKWRAAS